MPRIIVRDANTKKIIKTIPLRAVAQTTSIPVDVNGYTSGSVTVSPGDRDVEVYLVPRFGVL